MGRAVGLCLLVRDTGLDDDRRHSSAAWRRALCHAVTRWCQRVTDRTGRQLAGIVCLCAGVAAFSLQDILVKWLSGSYPIHQVIVIRSLVALPLLLIFVHYEAGILALRARRPGMLALRGAILLACYTTFYLSVAGLPLATPVALSFFSPLFIAALAWPMLGERVGIRRLLSIVVGFASVLVVCARATACSSRPRAWRCSARRSTRWARCCRAAWASSRHPRSWRSTRTACSSRAARSRRRSSARVSWAAATTPAPPSCCAPGSCRR
ncbi:MAG: DMT family transporter [Alphaproteobacteria bacterium]|nr:DMT family transporter [Alphaproteobacteria bacterium]